MTVINLAIGSGADMKALTGGGERGSNTQTASCLGGLATLPVWYGSEYYACTLTFIRLYGVMQVASVNLRAVFGRLQFQ